MGVMLRCATLVCMDGRVPKRTKTTSWSLGRFNGYSNRLLRLILRDDRVYMYMSVWLRMRNRPTPDRS